MYYGLLVEVTALGVSIRAVMRDSFRIVGYTEVTSESAAIREKNVHLRMAQS
jgi:hypothetical protein